MTYKMRTKHFIFLYLFLFGFTLQAQMDEKQLDELIQKTLTTFDVPGISVGILKDNQIIYSRGFGVRSLNSQKPMNAETKVGVASNSKALPVLLWQCWSMKENSIGMIK